MSFYNNNKMAEFNTNESNIMATSNMSEVTIMALDLDGLRAAFIAKQTLYSNLNQLDYGECTYT